MLAELSARKVCQDRVAARLSTTGFPAALEFQVGERVTGAALILPDSARKSGDQFCIRAVAQFADRFPFCLRQFYPQIELPQNREGKRENDDFRSRFSGAPIALKGQSESSSVIGNRFQAGAELDRALEALRKTGRHTVVSLGNMKTLVAFAEDAGLVGWRFVAPRQEEI